MSVDQLIQLRLTSDGVLLARSYDATEDTVDLAFSPIDDLLDETPDSSSVWLDCVLNYRVLYDLDLGEWQAEVRIALEESLGNVSELLLTAPEILPCISISGIARFCVSTWRTQVLLHRRRNILLCRILLRASHRSVCSISSIVDAWKSSVNLVKGFRKVSRFFDRNRASVIFKCVRTWFASAFGEEVQLDWEWTGIFRALHPIRRILGKGRSADENRVTYHCSLEGGTTAWIPVSVLKEEGEHVALMIRDFNRRVRQSVVRSSISPSVSPDKSDGTDLIKTRAQAAQRVAKLLGTRIPSNVTLTAGNVSIDDLRVAQEQAAVAAQRASFCESPPRRKKVSGDEVKGPEVSPVRRLSAPTEEPYSKMEPGLDVQCPHCRSEIWITNKIRVCSVCCFSVDKPKCAPTPVREVVAAPVYVSETLHPNEEMEPDAPVDLVPQGAPSLTGPISGAGNLCPHCAVVVPCVTDKRCSACFKHIALRGVRCDSVTCSRVFNYEAEVALAIRHCPACDKLQDRFVESAQVAASPTKAPVTYNPVPTTLLRADGIDALAVISASQNTRFLCLTAGSTIPTKASACESGHAFLRKIKKLCDGQQGSFVFGTSTRFSVEGRLMLCMARGVEVGRIDGAASGVVKDTAAKCYHINEIRVQSTTMRYFDSVLLDKDALAGSINVIDDASVDSMDHLIRAWKLFENCLSMSLSDQYSVEFRILCENIFMLHEEEPAPKSEFSPSKCAFLVASVIKDNNACVDAFLEGAEHLMER